MSEKLDWSLSTGWPVDRSQQLFTSGLLPGIRFEKPDGAVLPHAKKLLDSGEPPMVNNQFGSELPSRRLISS